MTGSQMGDTETSAVLIVEEVVVTGKNCRRFVADMVVVVVLVLPETLGFGCIQVKVQSCSWVADTEEGTEPGFL